MKPVGFWGLPVFGLQGIFNCVRPIGDNSEPCHLNFGEHCLELCLPNQLFQPDWVRKKAGVHLHVVLDFLEALSRFLVGAQVLEDRGNQFAVPASQVDGQLSSVDTVLLRKTGLHVCQDASKEVHIPEMDGLIAVDHLYGAREPGQRELVRNR